MGVQELVLSQSSDFLYQSYPFGFGRGAFVDPVPKLAQQSTKTNTLRVGSENLLDLVQLNWLGRGLRNLRGGRRVTRGS